MDVGGVSIRCKNLSVCGCTMKKVRVAYVLLSLLLLIIGMSIYLFFRNLNSIVLSTWIPRPSLMDTPFDSCCSCAGHTIPLFLNTLRISIDTSTILGRLFVFNLPHGLWSLAGLLAIRAIWLTDVKWRAVYGGIFLVVISALEISQLSEARHGTFDVLDLASYGVSAFVESMTYGIKWRGIWNL